MNPRTAVRIDRTVGPLVYRLHRWMYRLTGGFFGQSSPVGPMLLLTTTGRKSGQARTVPLLYMEDGGRFVVVGSNGGRPQPPAWLLNLRAVPEAEVQVGGERRRVRAEILEGAARGALWERLTQFYAGWAHYQTLTERAIPAVVLTPVDDVGVTPSMVRLALLPLLIGLLATPVVAEDCIVIEDFSKATVGEFPPAWKVRKEAGKSVYTVQEEAGLRFLHARAERYATQAAKQLEWDLARYPVLAWSWRPVEFPKGADEKDGKNDSALSVYLMVPYSTIRGPKAVKYIWSERVPVGTRLESNGGLTQVRVLRSGSGQKGQWVDERVNVRDDYLAYFKEKDVPKPAGIAVLTDSDDTASIAQGDYAKFRACAE
jgi:deazaflavin-dependent oxidoreductase (nitroreductase family)